MNEGVVLSCIIGTNNTFSTDEINIIPDVYKLYLGETEQNIYLENNPVTILSLIHISEPTRPY